MAGQEEPLYDFPEPVQSSQQKFQGHQRTRGSLRSISVLDRLLLTVPVWLQLSINPATALHILQREPPGTFLVRKSRTSQKNVLCVRLADDSVPSFVRQFGIREEQSTLSLETSAISFPDLPRLISFYCVSRDVLPFPLELPDTIARATSHKELESISHMGIEFWNSHLNVRGPREAPKPENAVKPEPATTAPPAAPAQPGTEAPSHPDSDQQPKTGTEAGDATKQPAPENPTLFHEFCPITTRSPQELDYGIGMGALCFINPLFLQSQSALSRKRLLKRSLKVRVSMETSSMLSPPLAAPPPPPLMPKTKKRCKIQKQGQGGAPPGKDQPQGQSTAGQASAQSDLAAQDPQDAPTEAQAPAAPHLQPEEQENQPPAIYRDPAAQLPTLMEHLLEDSDYMQPPPTINFSHPPSLSPYHSPAAGAPPLFLKASPPLSPRSTCPSLSPYQSPVIAPKSPFALSPHDSPVASPSTSPKVPPSLSPFTTSPFSQLEEDVYHIPASIPLRADGQRSELGAVEKGAAAEGNQGEGGERIEEMHVKEEEKEEEEEEELSEGNEKLGEKGEEGESLVLQMSAACLEDTDSCSSFSSLEGAAETPPHLLLDQNSSSQEIT